MELIGMPWAAGISGACEWYHRAGVPGGQPMAISNDTRMEKEIVPPYPPDTPV